MPYRLLALFGAFAHLGDAILTPFTTFKKPRDKLVAAGARVSGALVLAALLAIGGSVAFVTGNEGSTNKTTTVYSIDQLSRNPDLGGKIYATVSATMDQDYVAVYNDKKYDSSDYILCDPSSLNCLIVVSKKTETEMSNLVHDDGSVTLTGMLRADSGEVESARTTLGTKVDGLTINTNILLREGDTPANPTVMYSIAAVAGLLALFLFIGWAIGFMVFRPAKKRDGFSTSGMTANLPIHVTGLIPGWMNGMRTLDKKAELRLPNVDPAAPAAVAPPIDLVWATKKAETGIRLLPGTTQAVIGTAYPIGGARPAIRVRFGKYKLIFAFDTAAARDQAFDQFRISAPMATSPDGTTANA